MLFDSEKEETISVFGDEQALRTQCHLNLTSKDKQAFNKRELQEQYISDSRDRILA